MATISRTTHIRSVSIRFDPVGEGDGPIWVVTYWDGAERWPYAYAPTDLEDAVEKIREWCLEPEIDIAALRALHGAEASDPNEVI